MGQKLNRREVIKSIGVSGLGLSQVVSVSEAGSSGVIVSDYRRADNSLDNGTISQLQKDVANKHRSLSGKSNPVPIGGPIVDDRSPKIVSYAIKVFPNGTSRYHASAVGEDPSGTEIRDAHRATEEFVNDIRSRRTPLEQGGK